MNRISSGNGRAIITLLSNYPRSLMPKSEAFRQISNELIKNRIIVYVAKEKENDMIDYCFEESLCAEGQQYSILQHSIELRNIRSQLKNGSYCELMG